MSNRLTNKGYTFRDVYKFSLDYYLEKDDKAVRAKIDVSRAKLTGRNNVTYNPKTHSWEQDGRDIRLRFIVITNPVSYSRPSWDEGKRHRFPVTFLIHSLERGLDSSFRWRTGSLKKPKFAKSGMSKEKKQQLQEKNIKNGIQHQFFFELEYVLKMNKLLYGICHANKPPVIKNPKNKIFFDKHALFCFNRIVYPFITSKKAIYANKIARNVLKEKYSP